MNIYPSSVQALEQVQAQEDRDALKDLTFVRGDGDPAPDLILVKDVPTWKEAKVGRIFMGDEGVAVRQGMQEAGLKAYYTSTFPYRVNDKPKLTEMRRASDIIRYELDALKEKCNKVILFGASTVKTVPQFTEEVQKFKDLFHRPYENDGWEFRVMPHPAQIAASPQLYRDFLNDAKAFHLGVTEKKDVPVPRSEHYVVHTTRARAAIVLNVMQKVSRVAIDLETGGLNPYEDQILTIQMSWTPGRGHAFPWKLFSPGEWADWLQGKNLVFQNGTFDVKFLAMNGVWVRVGEDTMLMHSLLDETPGTHNMEGMAHKYLGIDKWSDMVDYSNMELETVETLGRYGARDADITLRLANVFRSTVQGRHITSVLHDAQNAIIRAELKGVRVNRELAFTMQQDIESALEARRDYMGDVYGLENPNSPKQVGEMLYETLGLPIQKDKGKVTTNEEAMEALAEHHSLPKEILEYRHLTKASGTYLRRLLESSERDGRYHGDFKLAATETGRLTEKLLMLIPRPDNIEGADLGKTYQYRLRELFIADEGYKMIGADYSGLEVSMAAHLTGDRQLITDIANQLDTHSVVAIQAFNLPIELEPYATLKQRTQASYGYQREMAKRGTFTWLYGGEAAALASNVGTDKPTAERILDALRTRYAGVARWQDAVRVSVQRDGSISTPWGRTRRFFFHSGLGKRGIEAQLREAINSPNQGMSSDINLAAFSALDAKGFDMLFPFHDAIYLQAPESSIQQVSNQVRAAMESVIISPVKFRADVKIGDTWAQLSG